MSNLARAKIKASQSLCKVNLSRTSRGQSSCAKLFSRLLGNRTAAAASSSSLHTLVVVRVHVFIHSYRMNEPNTCFCRRGIFAEFRPFRILMTAKRRRTLPLPPGDAAVATRDSSSHQRLVKVPLCHWHRSFARTYLQWTTDVAHAEAAAATLSNRIRLLRYGLIAILTIK